MKQVKLETQKKKLPKSEIELTITIPQEEIKKAIEKTYAKLAPKVEVTGFRPGKAPREKILAKLGPILYEQTLNYLLPEATMITLEKEGLTPLDSVRYNIEKFEAEGEIVYTATFPVFPDIRIGNLNKIKVTKTKATITEKEIEEALNIMFANWKKLEEEKFEAEKKELEKTKKVKDTDKAQAILKYSKPTDQWAKDQENLKVKNLAELREKIREELRRQKESIAEADFQNEIVRQAVKLSKIEAPAIFIKEELNRRVEGYKSRLEQLGLKFEDFLRAQKMTIEKLKEGMSDNAKAFVESEMFLLLYAKEKDIEVGEEEVQKQIDETEDKETRKKLNTTDGRRYIKDVLQKQKAFNHLVDFVKKKRKS